MNLVPNTDGSIETGTIFSAASDTYNVGSSDAYYDQMNADDFNNMSDARLKDNVEDLKLGLNFVRSLVPRRFNFKAKPDVKRYGFLAQEIADSVLVNSEGRFLSLRYNDMIPILVNAIKELAEGKNVVAAPMQTGDLHVFFDGSASDNASVKISKQSTGMYTIDFSAVSLSRTPYVFVQIVSNAPSALTANLLFLDSSSGTLPITNDKGMKTNSEFFFKICG